MERDEQLSSSLETMLVTDGLKEIEALSPFVRMYLGESRSQETYEEIFSEYLGMQDLALKGQDGQAQPGLSVGVALTYCGVTINVKEPAQWSFDHFVKPASYLSQLEGGEGSRFLILSPQAAPFESGDTYYGLYTVEKTNWVFVVEVISGIVSSVFMYRTAGPPCVLPYKLTGPPAGEGSMVEQGQEDAPGPSGDPAYTEGAMDEPKDEKTVRSDLIAHLSESMEADPEKAEVYEVLLEIARKVPQGSLEDEKKFSDMSRDLKFIGGWEKHKELKGYLAALAREVALHEASIAQLKEAVHNTIFFSAMGGLTQIDSVCGFPQLSPAYDWLASVGAGRCCCRSVPHAVESIICESLEGDSPMEK